MYGNYSYTEEEKTVKREEEEEEEVVCIYEYGQGERGDSTYYAWERIEVFQLASQPSRIGDR